MPSIDWNRRKWDVNYHWNADGDMWSRGYGGPAMQWRLSLLPRILPFVPAGSILEIAPGFGRWTQFLFSAAVGPMIMLDSPRLSRVAERR